MLPPFSGIEAKQKHVSILGMDRLLPDVAVQQRRLLQHYLDAEATQLSHLQQVAEVRSRVEVCSAVSGSVLSAASKVSSAFGLSGAVCKLLLRFT